MKIKANYVDIHTGISKLIENFEKVQKPINDVANNDVVGKIFETLWQA